MQYLGNIETGEVCASSNWDILNKISRASALLSGLAVEITDKQKGEFKAILRKKDPTTKEYKFEAFTSRSWKKALEYKKDGWEMRKDYDSKTTFDEEAFGIEPIKNPTK